MGDEPKETGAGTEAKETSVPKSRVEVKFIIEGGKVSPLLIEGDALTSPGLLQQAFIAALNSTPLMMRRQNEPEIKK